jgi:hypothetical protein
LSYAKFSPITASLLARKGEAAPSLAAKRAVDWTSDAPAVFEPLREIRAAFATAPESPHPEHAFANPEPAHIAHKRRIVVSLDPCEFERLGIAAVKKGMGRPDLVRAVMNDYLARLASELNGRCACLRDGSQCTGSRADG